MSIVSTDAKRDDDSMRVGLRELLSHKKIRSDYESLLIFYS